MDKKVIDPSGMEAQEFPWGRIKWLHSAALSGAEELTFGEVTINPGFENYVHNHPNCEEILYLLSGELMHAIGDEGSHRLTPGMSIRIPRGVKHNAECVSDEPAVMLVSYSSPARETREE